MQRSSKRMIISSLLWDCLREGLNIKLKKTDIYQHFVEKVPPHLKISSTLSDPPSTLIHILTFYINIIKNKFPPYQPGGGAGRRSLKTSSWSLKTS